MSSRSRFAILSITFALTCLKMVAAGEDKSFRAGNASQYAHLESEKVTVGAKVFSSEESIEEAFGKNIAFTRYGVVPVLVVIENKREKALDLRSMELNLVAADGRHATAVAPEDLPFLATAGKHPSQNPVHVPSPVPLPKKKNPLNASEITTRAFSAKMLAPGDSANGFVYFEAAPEAGDKLYVDGMKDARTGQDLLYFEFPLEKAP